MIESLYFVLENYPTPDNPEMAFIRPTVTTIADMGIKCTVFVPQSITHLVKYKKNKRQYKWYDVTDKGTKITIIQPCYLSLSNAKIGDFAFSSYFRTKALKKAIKKNNETPDGVYGHFWHCGIEAAEAIDGVAPVIVVSGESEIWVNQVCGKKKTEKWINDIVGLMAVSSKNLVESKEYGLLERKIKNCVIPNAIDSSLFYQKNRSECRKKLNISQNETIAVFVGAFSERKGVLRVVEAAKQIPDLKLILIGRGEQTPVSNQIIYSGVLAHEEIVDYLNAADFFVLPTLAEGCCNAIIEAMACGLPVISSDRMFNNDILDETNSIKIDPMSVSELAMAMEKLTDDKELRERLAEAALRKAEELQIEKRARKIVEFIDSVV